MRKKENTTKQQQWWRIKRANWTQFQRKNIITIKVKDQVSIEEAYSCYILHAAQNIFHKILWIKKRPPGARRKLVWAEYRKNRQNPTNKTKLRYFQFRRVIKQEVFRKARKETWSSFVNSLNERGTNSRKSIEVIKPE